MDSSSRSFGVPAVQSMDVDAHRPISDASGDDAIVALYVEHGAALRAFARSLIGDPQSAEDLVHDVFVCLPKALCGYRGDGGMLSFLRGMAINHARHHVRAAMRRRAAMDRLAHEAEQASNLAPQLIEQRALSRRLSAALDALPLHMRVAFVLCEVEELSSAEAAQIIHVPAATVRTRVARAKERLRKLLWVGP